MNALRLPVWAAIVATLIALALLQAFKQVVAQAVTQGDLRRMATASQVESAWRCKLLRHAGERGSCLVQLSLAQSASPDLPTPSTPAPPPAPQKQRLHASLVP